MSDSIEAARKWAATLDADDFDALPDLLTDDCRYHSPQGVLTGPEAIVASYRSSSEWAHDTFDSISWDSECELEGRGTVLVTFIDITDHEGEHHEYRCQQRITLDEDLLVAEIEHIAIPEEEAALAEFLERLGIRR